MCVSVWQVLVEGEKAIYCFSNIQCLGVAGYTTSQMNLEYKIWIKVTI